MVGSIVVNDLEYLEEKANVCLPIGSLRWRGSSLGLFSFLVFFFAILSFQRVVCMQFDLLLDDILKQTPLWHSGTDEF